MSYKLDQKARDLKAIRESMDAHGEIRLHIIHSRSGGTCTARMWHPDGFVMGKAGGWGYSKSSAVLAQALCLLFTQEELKALPLPTPRPNGSQDGLYGLYDSPSGKRGISEGIGDRSVLQILEALGWKAEIYETGKYSSMLIARRNAETCSA